MKIAVFILALASIASAQEVSECKVAGLKNVKACAAKLDYYGNSKPRPGVKNGVVTDLGLQFHPSCVQLGVDQRFTKAKTEQLLKKWVDRVYKTVTQDCAAKHPSLKKYIFGDPDANHHGMGWLTQARRTVITCVTDYGPNSPYAGMNYGSKASALNGIPEDAREGIPFTGDSDDSLATSHQPVISFSKKIMGSAISAEDFVGGTSTLDSLLIHEIFHSTNANNLYDHGERELISVPEKYTCDKNIADDRVNLIAGLCTGEGGLWGNKRASQVLFERMTQCGKDKGCVDAFTSEIPGFWESGNLADGIANSYTKKYAPSVPLSLAEATDLCQEIQDDGYCERIRTTQPDMLALSHKKLTAIGARIAARVEAVVPNATNDIPAAVLSAFPELAEQAAALSGSPCFAAAFLNRYEAGKPLYLRNPAPHGIASDERPHGLGISHMDRFDEARKRLAKSERCKAAGEAELKKVTHLLKQTESRMVTSYKSESYVAMAHPRYLGKPETRISVDLSWATEARKEAHFAQLMGSELMTEYHKALERHHPASPKFDCVAAGLSPYRAAKLAAKAKASTDTAQSCPK